MESEFESTIQLVVTDTHDDNRDQQAGSDKKYPDNVRRRMRDLSQGFRQTAAENAIAPARS